MKEKKSVWNMFKLYIFFLFVFKRLKLSNNIMLIKNSFFKALVTSVFILVNKGIRAIFCSF